VPSQVNEIGLAGDGTCWTGSLARGLHEVNKKIAGRFRSQCRVRVGA